MFTANKNYVFSSIRNLKRLKQNSRLNIRKLVISYSYKNELSERL